MTDALARLREEAERLLQGITPGEAREPATHVHTKQCYDDPGPAHGHPTLVCEVEARETPAPPACEGESHFWWIGNSVCQCGAAEYPTDGGDDLRVDIPALVKAKIAAAYERVQSGAASERAASPQPINEEQADTRVDGQPKSDERPTAAKNEVIR